MQPDTIEEPADAAPTGSRGAPDARRRRWDRDVPPARGLGLRLYLVAVFLISLQLEIDAFAAVAETRLPPGDFFLALSVLAAPWSLRLRSDPISMLPLAMVATLGFGLVTALVNEREVTSHALMVKFVGALVLVVWCLVTVYHVRAGHGLRILRVWLIGMAFWGVVAYIDQQHVDIFPFLDHKIQSRFGAMLFDPNNAGAAYAMATAVALWLGRRAFTTNWARFLVLGICAAGLLLTFSRGGYIAFAASVLVVGVVGRLTISRLGRLVLVALVIVGAGVLSGVVGDAVDDFQRRPDTVSARGDIVERSLDGYADSRGLGIGLGTYRVENDQIIHNTALWLVVEMSVIGLALFVALAIVPAQRCLKAPMGRDVARALLAAHVAMLVASVGIEALYQRYWWLIIGLCAWPAVVPGASSPRGRAVPSTTAGAAAV